MTGSRERALGPSFAQEAGESAGTVTSLREIVYKAVSGQQAAEYRPSGESESVGLGTAQANGEFDVNDVRAPENLEILDTVVLLPGRPGLLDIMVRHGDTLYHVVVGLRALADEARFFADCGNPVLGLYEDSEGLAVAVDALEDQEMVTSLSRFILGSSGIKPARRLPHVLTGTIRKETSDGNSAVYVIDETVMCTIIRSLTAGKNPGIDMLLALDDAGFNNMFAPIATWTRGGYDLGILQEYMPGTSSGWDVALTSLRDMCSAQCAPQDAGADFALEAYKIGEMLARMHLALDKAYGRYRMDIAAFLDSMGRWTVQGTSDGDRAGAYQYIQLLSKASVPFYQVRLHGSFDLNSVRRGEYGWYLGRVVEGASGGAPLFFSPLYDLATLLTSLHDVALAALAERDPLSAGEVGRLVEAWEDRNGRILIKGYLNVAGIVGIVPPQEEYFDALLHLMKPAVLHGGLPVASPSS
ncbi:MAG: hypothetical protein M1399_03955 [Actinobacteria bacterium]|nr:hypothetical protein [Actinomycetota bacterium]MCL5447545.1 hypothetical protein [Actinomycetota bacterium]